MEVHTNLLFKSVLFFFRDSSSSLSCQTSFPSPSSEPSVFREQSPLSPSEIANYLRDELKRLRKRRQLAEPYPPRSPPASPGSPEPMMADSTGADRAMPSGITHQQAAIAQPGPSSSKSLNASSTVMTKISKGDRPVFTLKQMTMICEKMCKVCYFVIHK